MYKMCYIFVTDVSRNKITISILFLVQYASINTVRLGSLSLRPTYGARMACDCHALQGDCHEVRDFPRQKRHFPRPASVFSATFE